MAQGTRNPFVDVMRGIAMLLVVLGHTMTGCLQDAEQSCLYNIVWSLQMPLFFLISGYVTRYSRCVGSSRELGEFVLKRTCAYLLPWVVWTFFIRGFLFRDAGFTLDLRYIFWHMDSGYWFLVTIWTINIVFGIAQFLASRFCKEKNELLYLLSITCAYCLGMGALFAVGKLVGLSFFSIKLTLYYMPFYFVGYLCGLFHDRFFTKPEKDIVKDIVVLICTALWLIAVTRVNLFFLSDRGQAIVFRAGVSLAGCISVFGLCRGIFSEKPQNGFCVKTQRFFCLIGKHSIEFYLTHYLFLCIIKLTLAPVLLSVRGVGLVILNYAITLALTGLTIVLTLQNRVLRAILFGKIHLKLKKGEE